jgi:hypothetical protein
VSSKGFQGGVYIVGDSQHAAQRFIAGASSFSKIDLVIRWDFSKGAKPSQLGETLHRSSLIWILVVRAPPGCTRVGGVRHSWAGTCGEAIE